MPLAGRFDETSNIVPPIVDIDSALRWRLRRSRLMLGTVAMPIAISRRHSRHSSKYGNHSISLTALYRFAMALHRVMTVR